MIGLTNPFVKILFSRAAKTDCYSTPVNQGDILNRKDLFLGHRRHQILVKLVEYMSDSFCLYLISSLEIYVTDLDHPRCLLCGNIFNLDSKSDSESQVYPLTSELDLYSLG